MNHATLLAQIKNPVLPASIGGGSYTSGGTALGTLISNIIGGLLVAGFLLSFVFLIMGGFTWITAGGDKTKLEKARDEITNAIVGIVIVAASYALATLIAKFFGLDLQNLTVPTIK